MKKDALIRKIVILAILITPSLIYSQDAVVKTDTIFNNLYQQKIQTISEIIGNKKKLTSYYDNGKIKTIELFIDNKLDGNILRWDLNGNKKEESVYSKGYLLKKMLWFANGTLEIEENYLLIQIDSLYKSVYDGKCFKNYINGFTQIVGSYKSNKKCGIWIEYFENGFKKSSINYNNDYKDGKAEYWFKSGIKSAEYNYVYNKKELLNGKQIRYFENGKCAEQSNYKMGKKDGLYKDWYENGNIKSKIKYSNDEVCGISKKYMQDGSLKEYSKSFLVYDSLKKYKRTVYDGKYILYDDKGKLQKTAQYIKGKEIGTVVQYYNNSTQKHIESNYKKGLKKGKSTTWHSNGNVCIEENYTIVNVNDTLKSLQDGDYLKYTDQHSLIEKGTYINGNKEGLWTKWYENGIKASVEQYCNNIKCGKQISWNKDSSLAYECVYELKKQNGKDYSYITGQEKKYDEHGKINQIQYYSSNGYGYKIEEYNTNGKLKTEIVDYIKQEYSRPYCGRKLSYYSNGRLEKIAIYINGRQAGRVLSYYINGNIKSIEDFNGNGEAIGYSLLWDSDGLLNYFRNYKKYNDYEDVHNDKLAQEIYNNYMHKSIEQSLLDTVTEGKYIAWLDINHKLVEENHQKGMLQGLCLAYYPDGKQMFQIEMNKSVPNGKFTIWLNNGKKNQEGRFKDGEKDSVWTSFLIDGSKKIQTNFKVGDKFPSRDIEWYPNGNRYIERDLHRGKVNGCFSSWYENGQLKYECSQSEGILNGVCREYYQNGKRKSESFYKSGKLEGDETKWFETGKLDQKAHYINGKSVGSFTRWYENGHLLLQGYFNKKEEQDSIWLYYSENGNLKKKEQYKNGILSRKPKGNCECIDSTKHKERFIPALSTLLSLEDANKLCLKFHAPLDSNYNQLFYDYYNSMNGRDFTQLSFDLVAYQPIYMYFPDTNGIKILLNPCIPIASNELRMHCLVSYSNNDNNLYNISIDNKNIAIDFNINLLHQWDNKNSVALKDESNNLIPATILCEIKNITYNTDDHFKIDNIKNTCFSTSEIGNTGVSLDFSQFQLNLDGDASFNDDETKLLQLFGFSEKKKFIGIHINNAKLNLPKKILNTKQMIQVEGENIFISGQNVWGIIHIKATLTDKFQYTLNNDMEKITFNSDMIEQNFKNKGYSILKTEYNTSQTEFDIYFNYSINK